MSTTTVGKTLVAHVPSGGAARVRPVARATSALDTTPARSTIHTTTGSSVSNEYIHAIGSDATMSHVAGQNRSRVKTATITVAAPSRANANTLGAPWRWKIWMIDPLSLRAALRVMARTPSSR